MTALPTDDELSGMSSRLAYGQFRMGMTIEQVTTEMERALRDVRKRTLLWALKVMCPYCWNGEPHDRCWAPEIRKAAEHD